MHIYEFFNKELKNIFIMNIEAESEKPWLYADLKRGYELRTLLSEISDGLQTYDKISVIFLLCATPQVGITIMEAILTEQDVISQSTLFYKWFRHQFTTENWRDKLIECLTILQNYKLAKIMGFTKKELINMYEPKNNLKTHWVSNVRKVLYNLCEALKPEEYTCLVNMVESSQHSLKTDYLLKCKYLEYKLLVWSREGLINLEKEKAIDVQSLVFILKSFHLQNFVYDIEIVVEKTNCQALRRKSTMRLKSKVSEYYEIIDEKQLGLCVIINEKNFTSSLFPKRWGSDKDAERLTEVFMAFGFTIKIHSDLSYKEFMKTLEFYAKTVEKTSSFFVLIILSHGCENVIFTSDSLPVDMNTIEMIFQAEVCPNLIGKPKIFIVQSCQGEKWQKVIQDSKLEIDADNYTETKSKQQLLQGPQKGDSMIAWSTVQGFASFRDKYNGSWYIQELCNELWKFGDTFDLVEIFTKVNNNLRSKIYGCQFMVPSLLLSLRAKVQFRNLRENFLKGRKLMFERLIFEKCFKDFLISCKTLEFGIFSQQD